MNVHRRHYSVACTSCWTKELHADLLDIYFTFDRCMRGSLDAIGSG